MPSTEPEVDSSSRILPDSDESEKEESSPFDFDDIVDEIEEAVRDIDGMLQEDPLDEYRRKSLSSGERAELRRTDSDHPFTPTLWKVLFEVGYEEAPSWWWRFRPKGTGPEEWSKEWEQRWAVLLQAMTTCRDQHADNIRLGTALANAGWAEMRFVRLMETNGQELETHVRHMAQYLASTGEALDWTDVAKLLFFQEGETAQNIRVGISRAYYGRKQMLEQESDQD